MKIDPKDALDFLHKIANLKTNEELRDKVMELKEKCSSIIDTLLSLQTHNLELIKANEKQAKVISDLRAQLAGQHAKEVLWDNNRDGYEKYSPIPHVTYYRKKGTDELFCAHCFDSQKLSRLQLQFPNEPVITHLLCPLCKTEFPAVR